MSVDRTIISPARWAALIAMCFYASSVMPACSASDDAGSGGSYGDAGVGGTGGGTGGGGTGGGGTGGTGGGGTGGIDADVPATCDNACCPDLGECYVAGNPGPGAECMAQRQNTTSRFQLRQVWTRDVLPAGIADPAVYGERMAASQLAWANCNMPNGTGGYIELLDVDLSDADPSRHVARRGYASAVDATSLTAARTEGLCFFEGLFFDEAWALRSELGDASAYPHGLPPPQPQPWVVRPGTLRRLTEDFDLAADRARILLELENSEFDGVFYFDDSAGRWHGYMPVHHQVLYEAAEPIVIPVREVETELAFNDPASPQCAGALREPAAGCSSTSALDPPWGCEGDSCTGEGPATSRGYLLITEIEQVWSASSAGTLCVTSPTLAQSESDGWSDPLGWGNNCRGSPNWNPSDPLTGLPEGDWCAATNGPATATCHDAYRLETFQAFAAFPIREGTCRSSPAAEAAAGACPGTAVALAVGDAIHTFTDGAPITSPVGAACSDGPARGGIWALTASESGTLRVNVAPFPGAGSFDGSISLRTECAEPGTTFVCSGERSLRTVEVPIGAGETRYLVAQTSSPFDIVVALDAAGCGDGVVNPGEDCDYGDTRDGDGCDASCRFEPPGASDVCPGEVTTIAPGESKVLPGHTINYADDYAAPCGAKRGGPDRVFGVNPTQSGTLRLELRSSFDAVLSVYTTCLAPALDGLLRCSDGPRAGDTESLELDVIGGWQYFVVVDGYLPASYGPFDLTVRLDPR